MELELEHTFESVDREAPELVTEADPDETVAAVGGQDAADHPPVLHPPQHGPSLLRPHQPRHERGHHVVPQHRYKPS